MASMDEAAAAMASDDDEANPTSDGEMPPELAAWYRAQGLEVTRIADLAPRFGLTPITDAEMAAVESGGGSEVDGW